MIVGKQNIIYWFESLNVPYWVLFPKGKVESGNPIAKSNDQDNATVADAIELLKNTLNLQSRGQFTLIAAGKSNVTSRGGFRTDFEIPSAEGAPQQTTQEPGIYGMPKSIGELDELTSKRAANMVETVKLEMKVERLQDQIKELEKENKELARQADAGSNKFWEAVNGIGLEKIIGAFVKQPQAAPAPAVTGVEAPPENDVEYFNRVQHVLEVFQEHDPDWLDTLEKMASKIEKDPSVIKMFKKFL